MVVMILIDDRPTVLSQILSPANIFGAAALSIAISLMWFAAILASRNKGKALKISVGFKYFLIPTICLALAASVIGCAELLF
jgi:EamA domain-containing membrane protein RarD